MKRNYVALEPLPSTTWLFLCLNTTSLRCKGVVEKVLCILYIDTIWKSAQLQAPPALIPVSVKQGAEWAPLPN